MLKICISSNITNTTKNLTCFRREAKSSVLSVLVPVRCVDILFKAQRLVHGQIYPCLSLCGAMPMTTSCITTHPMRRASPSFLKIDTLVLPGHAQKILLILGFTQNWQLFTVAVLLRNTHNTSRRQANQYKHTHVAPRFVLVRGAVII